MKYKDILDIEFAIDNAERAAKKEWDGVVKWKTDEPDGGILYKLHYDKVKELREARKKIRGIWDEVSNAEGKIKLEYEYSN